MRTYQFKLPRNMKYFNNIHYNNDNQLCFSDTIYFDSRACYNLFTKEYVYDKFETIIDNNKHLIISNNYYVNNMYTGYLVKQIDNNYYCYNRIEKLLVKFNKTQLNTILHFTTSMHTVNLSKYEDLLYSYFDFTSDKLVIQQDRKIIKIKPVANFDTAISPNGQIGAYLKNRNRVVLFDTQNFAIKSEFKINSARHLAFDNENITLSCIGSKQVTEIDLD